MSKQPNEKNERLKRRFLEYRKHARQLSEASLDSDISALERFDVWNGRKDFALFHIQQAMEFRAHLEKTKGATGKPLGKSTMKAILATLREFILWLSQQEGFRSRIKASDADYFKLSRRDEAEARAAPARPAPSVNQAKQALRLMPDSTARQKRDKAVFALLCLTGIRVTALTSLRIKHIDTFFVRGFDEAECVLKDWLAYLDETLLYGPDDPLFPATAVAPKSNTGYATSGFERRCWKRSDSVRKVVRSAFEAAGLPNYGPHTFRHMIARRTARTSKSVAELIAHSQNLGHTDVLTTLRSYGQNDRDRQRQLVTGLIDEE